MDKPFPLTRLALSLLVWGMQLLRLLPWWMILMGGVLMAFVFADANGK